VCVYEVRAVIRKLRMDEETKNKDRQVIEDYLKSYNLEEILDETINDIIERRPTNPYVELAQLIESKTIPEIVEVGISSTLIACGAFGIEAILRTNLGPFRGDLFLLFVRFNSP
jgi:hypothetical protein